MLLKAVALWFGSMVPVGLVVGFSIWRMRTIRTSQVHQSLGNHPVSQPPTSMQSSGDWNGWGMPLPCLSNDRLQRDATVGFTRLLLNGIAKTYRNIS